jgi:hypothetical protein
MASVQEIATWMATEVETKGELYQEEAACEIEHRFGSEFVYENDNGNSAISREVLKEFRKLTPNVIWDASERYWRERTKFDGGGRRAE